MVSFLSRIDGQVFRGAQGRRRILRFEQVLTRWNVDELVSALLVTYDRETRAAVTAVKPHDG